VYHVLNRSVAGLPQFFHSLAAPRRSAVEADGESEERAASRFDPLRFKHPSAFRPTPLTRLPVLPSSMHKTWAGSESYKISGVNTVYGWPGEKGDRHHKR
jgi:hypothetical protein